MLNIFYKEYELINIDFIVHIWLKKDKAHTWPKKKNRTTRK